MTVNSLWFFAQRGQVLRHDDPLEYKDRFFDLLSHISLQYAPGGGLFQFLYFKYAAEGVGVLFVQLAMPIPLSKLVTL